MPHSTMRRPPLRIRRSCATLVALAMTAMTAMTACGASPSAPEPRDELASALSTGAGAAASEGCDHPSRYIVAGEPGICAIVPGANGAWVPGALFPGAPAAVSSSMCLFTWKGSAAPDTDAIQGIARYRSGLVPLCDGEPPAGHATARSTPRTDPPYQGVGIAGCDVCGLTMGRRAWVVLPSDVVARQFQVPLTNGTSPWFVIPPTTARSLSLLLPPPPKGASYVDGRFTVQ